MVIVLASAITSFAALPCLAQTTEGTGVLDLTLSRSEITVGDRIEARLTLVWTGPEPVAEPRFPAWQTTWGDAEVLSAGEVETSIEADARRVYRQDLVLTAFHTGEIRLPDVRATLPLEHRTIEVAVGREIRFEVRSVLPEAPQEAEPRPPAPPAPLAAEARFVWTASGLGALGLLAAWLLGRRLKVPPATATRPPADPLEELLEHLANLDPTAAEPAHTGLSLGLRRFLGRSFSFRATESTTTEIERRLRRAHVGAEIAGDTAGLLRDCDLVKFARAPVAAPTTRGRLRQARALGQGIERRLRPTPDDVGATPASPPPGQDPGATPASPAPGLSEGDR